MFFRYAGPAQEFKHASLCDPATSKKLSNELCKAVARTADCYPSPWKIQEDSSIHSLALMKPSEDRKKIEVLQVVLGAREAGDGKHEIYASEVVSSAFADNCPFCKLIGMTTHGKKHDSQLNPTQESLTKAVEWAAVRAAWSILSFFCCSMFLS